MSKRPQFSLKALFVIVAFRRDYRNLLIIATSGVFLFVLSYFTCPVFRAIVDKWISEVYKWISEVYKWIDSKILDFLY